MISEHLSSNSQILNWWWLVSELDFRYSLFFLIEESMYIYMVNFIQKKCCELEYLTENCIIFFVIILKLSSTCKCTKFKNTSKLIYLSGFLISSLTFILKSEKIVIILVIYTIDKIYWKKFNEWFLLWQWPIFWDIHKRKYRLLFNDRNCIHIL